MSRCISERRNVCMAKSPEIVAYIGPADADGKRLMFVNIAAAPDAKIIRILVGNAKNP